MENQEVAERRISKLLFVPAKTRFISVEPILGPITIYGLLAYGQWDLNQDVKHTQKIHWVIIGGESGNETGDYRYRPAMVDWIIELKNQCYSAWVPCFIKQLGSRIAKELKLKDRFGGDMDEFPDALRVRMFPAAVGERMVKQV